MHPIAWTSPVRVQAIPLPTVDESSQGARGGGLRSVRVSSAHRVPATPVVWPGTCRLACKLSTAALSSDAVALWWLHKAKEIVLKAQILAGGRGKGVFTSGLKGGVHLTKDPAAVGQLAKQMLGFNLTTKQTPKEGVKVNTVMVAEALDISRETYFAILMDRACNGPVMVGSPQGGVDIEEVAASSPEKIFKEVIDIFQGVTDEQALCMAANLGFRGSLERQAADQIKKLYDLFLKVDATQVEVNPLGETPEGQVVCFDAKINFDDNAEFRQKEIFAMDNTSEGDPIETEAAKYDLKYIGLDGNIACFVNGAGLAMATCDIIDLHGGKPANFLDLGGVNGAGLAMATCDIIDLHGGKPANFLDLGGGVQESQVYQAFKLLTADPKILINYNGLGAVFFLLDLHKSIHFVLYKSKD
ncbi:UNVERIFIED_CONTAM: hypothetical protein FKN15_023599 [Acipenser sinensis]